MSNNLQKNMSFRHKFTLTFISKNKYAIYISDKWQHLNIVLESCAWPKESIRKLQRTYLLYSLGYIFICWTKKKGIHIYLISTDRL